MKKRWAALVIGLSVLVAIGRAQQQPPQQLDEPPPRGVVEEGLSAPTNDLRPGETVETSNDQTLIFRSGINYISVDVIATDDDGNPVVDLTADDFEVYEEEIAQEVDSFQLVEIDTLPQLADEPIITVGVTRDDQARAAAQVDVRVFVIFLDDYHVRFGNAVRARRMLIDFLQNDLIETDLVGVMNPLMPLEAVRLTRNHQAVINAVNDFRGMKYNYEIRNNFEAAYNMYPTEVVERIRNNVSLSALRGLMIYLGGLREGRKSVLVVSEGYSYYVPPQLRGQYAGTPVDPNINPSRLDPNAGDNPFEEARSFFDSAAIGGDLRRLYQTANRFNTSLYTVDPRGLAAFEFDADQPNVSFRTNRRELRRAQDTLRLLAEETDGRAIVNRNDLRPGLEQMLKDSNTYYLLGYNSSLQATDGKFHKIDVRVKREGVHIRARPGYWAVTASDAERSLLARTRIDEPPEAVDVALSTLSEPRRGNLIRTWVGTARAENGKTRVTFVWEPVQERGRRESASRVLVTAMGDNGSAYFRGRVPEDIPAGRGTVESRAPTAALTLGTRIQFDADPGTMQISLAVEGSVGEVLDRDLDEIVIPDFTSPDVVFSTPAFVRARNALEYRQIVDDWDVQPTVSRSFRRTDLLLLRFDAYAPTDVVPEIEARLLNRRGDVMFSLDVRPGSDQHPHQVELVPSFLAPAEYIIELRATTAESEATRLVAFRLGA